MWSLIGSSHAIANNLLVVLSQRLRHGNSVINKIKGLLDAQGNSIAKVDPESDALSDKRFEQELELKNAGKQETNINIGADDKSAPIVTPPALLEDYLRPWPIRPVQLLSPLVVAKMVLTQ